MVVSNHAFESPARGFRYSAETGFPRNISLRRSSGTPVQGLLKMGPTTYWPLTALTGWPRARLYGQSPRQIPRQLSLPHSQKA